VTAEHGRISAETFASVIDDPRTTAVMLCGPAPLLLDLSGQMRALGVPGTNIFMEGFGFR
jgi:ferredoxin-NADP reductase